MLQDMILVAVNDGLSQIATETEKQWVNTHKEWEFSDYKR